MLVPEEDAKEEKRDTFYDEIQQVNQEVQLHDVLCVIKDLTRLPGMTVNTDKIRSWGRMGVVTSTAIDPDSVMSVRRI